MTWEPVTISPSSRVKTAIVLMKGHHIGALPVVGPNQSVIGVVTHHQLLGEAEDALVPDLMDTEFVTCEPDMSIIEAAERMHDARANHILVVEDEKLVGIVADGDLLPEIGKTFDPLTGLPWTDTFREWALNALKHNIEICVMLFDLDQFGMFNKKYGHVVGDNVLKNFADIISAAVDTETDCACRYGGDEFAIVSIRHADRSIELAENICKAVSRVRIKDVPENVSATYGIAGGRRTREREDMHYAATIDNLITRASKECMAKKKTQKVELPKAVAAVQSIPQPIATRPAEEQFRPTSGRQHPPVEVQHVPEYPKPTLHDVAISTSQSEYKASVTVSVMGRLYTGTASRPTTGSRGLTDLVAEATATAVNQLLSPGFGLGIETVIVAEAGRGEDIVTVVAVLSTPTSSLRFPATTLAQRGDCLRPVANAVMEAICKQPESIYAIPDTTVIHDRISSDQENHAETLSDRI
jgi:diguanylate cyclase (GGDEF)-like protein